jgi:hypothetical protein
MSFTDEVTKEARAFITELEKANRHN